MNTGNCRSCGEEILWLKTKAGKNMPLNAMPEPGGTIRIVEGLAVVVPANDRNLPEHYLMLYKSHFSTCPSAAQHRSGRTHRMNIEKAKVIAVGQKVVVRDDSGHEATWEVKYAPWLLGGGQWVIGLKGKSGGYDLGRVVAVLDDSDSQKPLDSAEEVG